MPSPAGITGLAVALLLAQCAFGHSVTFRRLGQGERPQPPPCPSDDCHDGPKGPPHDHQPWWEALNCTTTPISLLDEEPTTYATFLDLVARLNLTDFLSRPTPFEDLRAPTQAFFQAWFTASNASALPDFAAYNRSELRHARRAVLGLLLPQDFFNHTIPGGPGEPVGKGPHDDHDMPPHEDGAMPPESQPDPWDGSHLAGEAQQDDIQPPQGGPQGDSPQDFPQDAPRGGNTDGPNSRRGLLSDPGQDHGAHDGARGDGGKDGDRPGGPDPSLGAPMNFTECPQVDLIPVDAIVEGSAGCRLEDCLPCAGVDGCTCVGCRCQCA